jgi:hypothetical protein
MVQSSAANDQAPSIKSQTNSNAQIKMTETAVVLNILCLRFGIGLMLGACDLVLISH